MRAGRTRLMAAIGILTLKTPKLKKNLSTCSIPILWIAVMAGRWLRDWIAAVNLKADGYKQDAISGHMVGDLILRPSRG